MDPTTIVAAGAALFAATQKLPPGLRRGSRAGSAISLSLEYESMTTNPAPLLVGRVEGGADTAGLAVRVRREDGQFDSGLVVVQKQRVFAVPLKLQKDQLNVFDVSVTLAGEPVAAEPTQFSILHGMSVAKPPLSQSVGVMLADNSVCWYLRKGAVLPTKNTVTHATTVPLARGQSADAIYVPLVQGESERADRNKVIGILRIHAERISRDLPAGSEIRVTLAVDEFSRTTARGYVPLLDQWFDEIVLFQMENKNAEEVAQGLGEQKDRLKQLDEQAQQLGSLDHGDIDERFREIEDLVAEGDRDSVELAEQMVRLMTRQLDRVEAQSSRDKLRADFADKVTQGQEILQTDERRQELAALQSEFQTALDRDDTLVAQAKYEAASDLIWRANLQRPEFWKGMLGWLYQRFTELNLLNVAQQQFKDGVAAMDRGQDGLGELILVCMELFDMLPHEERGQFSGVVAAVQSNVM
jgi:molecular chaperone DnaK